MKNQSEQSVRPELKTPRAAAIAGIIFSLLLTISIILIGVARPTESNIWITPILLFGLNLIPFAGIAFLWFIGVLRDRIGIYEDRFFATVFLGSGLLFLAMLFTAAAVAGTFNMISTPILSPAMVDYSQRITSTIMGVYVMKMAAVFMISTSTILLRTRVLSRWLAYIGYACALCLLVITFFWQWILLLFPFWIFLLSLDILVTNLRRGYQT